MQCFGKTRGLRDQEAVESEHTVTTSAARGIRLDLLRFDCRLDLNIHILSFRLICVYHRLCSDLSLVICSAT